MATAKQSTNKSRVVTAAPAPTSLDPRLGGFQPAPTPSAGDAGKAKERVKTGEAGELVTAVVPRPFKLNFSAKEKVSYEAGIIDMPRAHAEHWYAKQNGVEIK